MMIKFQLHEEKNKRNTTQIKILTFDLFKNSTSLKNQN
jgi:hypothetical protein